MLSADQLVLAMAIWCSDADLARCNQAAMSVDRGHLVGFE